MIRIEQVATEYDLPSLLAERSPDAGSLFFVRESGVIMQVWRWLSQPGGKGWVPFARIERGSDQHAGPSNARRTAQERTPEAK